MINRDNMEGIFRALDRQIEIRGGSPISIVVCGGTALFALGLILRTTKDVDVLGVINQEGKKIRVKKIDSFPELFVEASKIVQRDFGLPEEWINIGPTKQVETGLPKGFVSRLVKKEYGKYLTVYFISRLDQIHFKLYAAIDRGGYHVDDLFALKPTEEELRMAVNWALTQDVSEGFRIILKDFLKRYGYKKISQEI